MIQNYKGIWYRVGNTEKKASSKRHDQVIMSFETIFLQNDFLVQGVHVHSRSDIYKPLQLEDK